MKASQASEESERDASPLARIRYLSLQAVKILLGVAMAATGFWALGTIYFSPWHVLFRFPLAIGWIGFAVALIGARVYSIQPLWKLVIAYGVGLGILWLLWNVHQPTGEGNWALDQARMPVSHFDDNTVQIQNLRNAVYRTTDDFDVVWETREFNLDTIQTVDFVVEPFALGQRLAHTFLTFGFEDGRYVAISAEIRKRQGDQFSPIHGAFKQFELMYVIADERDLIGLRANIRQHPVRVYPCVASPKEARALFIAMLERANKLAREPEFYHSLHNNCTTSITSHLEQLGWQRWHVDRRLIFPGHADEVALERDLLNVNSEGSQKLDIDDIRRKYLINDRSEFGPENNRTNSKAWSRKIREYPSF